MTIDTNELRQVARNEGLWESEAVLVETAADEIDRLRALLSQPTMTEPTVQVLVSLIEQLPHDVECASNGWGNDAAHCDCWKSQVLSQPTPTAEDDFIERIRNAKPRADQSAFDVETQRPLGPTGEPIPCPHWEPGHITMRKGCTACAAPTEPPRIEDMAPGTTFTEASNGWPRTAWTVAQRHDGTRYAKRHSDGWVLDPKDIDPSTIRDVIPPKENNNG